MLKSNEVLIKINAIIPDDADDFHGAKIEDFDRDNCIALLIVDKDDVEQECNSVLERYIDDAWGQNMLIQEQWLKVISCKWNGFQVLNSEEVCDAIYAN